MSQIKKAGSALKRATSATYNQTKIGQKERSATSSVQNAKQHIDKFSRDFKERGSLKKANKEFKKKGLKKETKKKLKEQAKRDKQLLEDFKEEDKAAKAKKRKDKVDKVKNTAKGVKDFATDKDKRQETFDGVKRKADETVAKIKNTPEKIKNKARKFKRTARETLSPRNIKNKTKKGIKKYAAAKAMSAQNAVKMAAEKLVHFVKAAKWVLIAVAVVGIVFTTVMYAIGLSESFKPTPHYYCDINANQQEKNSRAYKQYCIDTCTAGMLDLGKTEGSLEGDPTFEGDHWTSANPYSASAGMGLQCTWFAYGRVYELYQLEGPTSGGGEWAADLVAKYPARFKLSDEPAPGAVYSTNTNEYHVGIVTAVDGDNITVEDGNYTGSPLSSYPEHILSEVPHETQNGWHKGTRTLQDLKAHGAVFAVPTGVAGSDNGKSVKKADNCASSSQSADIPETVDDIAWDSKYYQWSDDASQGSHHVCLPEKASGEWGTYWPLSGGCAAGSGSFKVKLSPPPADLHNKMICITYATSRYWEVNYPNEDYPFYKVDIGGPTTMAAAMPDKVTHDESKITRGCLVYVSYRNNPSAKHLLFVEKCEDGEYIISEANYSTGDPEYGWQVRKFNSVDEHLNGEGWQIDLIVQP